MTEDIVAIPRAEIHELANILGEIIKTNRDYLKLRNYAQDVNRITHPLDAITELFLPQARIVLRHIDTFLDRLDASKPSVVVEFTGRRQELATAIENTGLATPQKLAQLAHLMVSRIDFHKQSGAVALPKEPTKNLRASASDLSERIATYQLSQNLRLLDKGAKLMRDHLIKGRPTILEREHSDLSIVLDEVIESLRPMFEARNIRVDTPKSKSEHSKIKVPQSVAAKSIKAIVENAIKYTGELPPDSEYTNLWIATRVRDQDSHLILDVESWGIPITHEEHKERLYFRRGYRGYFAHLLNISGTGTGLADAAELVTTFGGSIELQTQPVDKAHNPQKSKKTTLSITLPKLTPSSNA